MLAVATSIDALAVGVTFAFLQVSILPAVGLIGCTTFVLDMIALNLQFNAENGHPFGTQEEAERMMRSWMPTLKRWRNAGAE